MDFSGKKANIAAILCILIAMTFLFFLFPRTGDDWFREEIGKSIGSVSDLVSVVSEKWQTTNGRIMGNILAYSAAGRFLLSAALSGIITTLLIVFMRRAAGLRCAASLFLTAAVIFIMPKEMFRQIYPWKAGFFNYVPPVAITLCCFSLMDFIFSGLEDKSGPAKHFLIFILSFLGQLFMENNTLYCIAAGISLCAISKISSKKLSKSAVFYTLGAVFGAVLLFLSPSYRAVGAVSSGGAYQSGLGGGLSGLISSALANQSEICRYLISGCPVLFASLGFGAVLLFLKSENRSSAGKAAVIVDVLGVLYFTLSKTGIISAPPTLHTVLCALWLVDICAACTLFIRRRDDALKAVFFILSAGAAAAPLLFVSPIGPRCLYVSYIFLLVAAAVMAKNIIPEKTNHKVLLPAAALVFVFAVGFYAYKFIPVQEAESHRLSIISSAMSKGESSVTLPPYPNGDYMWEPDCPEKMQSCFYYETPGDFLIFIG